MAEVIQCDACNKEVPDDEYVSRITIGRRKAIVGHPVEPSDEQEVCSSCIEGVRLHIALTGWPEVVEED